MMRRSALLTLLSLPLGYYKAFATQAGWLTIDLSQWAGITVKHGPDTIRITGREIFETLKEKP